MRQQDGITQADIANFERTAIIQKSLDVIKQKANQMKAVRGSP